MQHLDEKKGRQMNKMDAVFDGTHAEMVLWKPKQRVGQLPYSCLGEVYAAVFRWPEERRYS